MDDRNKLISLVNTRGRVMWVHFWEVDNLRRQGAKIIYNPKEEYYPQYDLTSPRQEQQEQVDMSNKVEETNLLEVDEV